MKIRNGFVSNSSSSSFCILGIQYKGYGADEKFETNEYVEKFEELSAKCYSDKECVLTIQYGIEEYYEGLLAGAYPGAMKDDETLKEFKQRIVADFKKYDIEVEMNDLEWHTDGGYEG